MAVIVLITSAMWTPTVQANSTPEAPANLVATAGDSQVTLTWEAPSSDGGSAITRYEYRHVLGTPTTLGALPWTSVGTALTVNVAGLINGRDYTFEVRAVSSVGGGAASSIEATPVGSGPLTALSVEPGRSSGGSVPVHRPGTISPIFNSSTYDYTVTVEQGDTHLTFNATTETGYGKQLRIVGDLGNGEFWSGARDLAPNLSGHQVRLSYGENWFRYAVHTGPEGTESDGTAEYHYNIRVTRPYPPNTPATGAPTISGTAQVGQTLTASTSGIADADGLIIVSYSYQWLADDTEIDGATSSTYTVQTSDNGQVIKVRVTFEDDAGGEESLTSVGTSAVVLGGL